MIVDELIKKLDRGETHFEKDLNEDVYHALSNQNIISSSQLKYLDKNSARHFHDKYIAGIIEDEKSDALDFGSLIHQAFLEGHHEQFVMCPKFDLRRKEDKLAKQQLLDENPDKILIAEDKWEAAKMILAELSQYREKYNIDDAFTEISLFWKDELNFRARCDAYCPNTKTLFELKTAKTVNPRFFSYDFFKLGYDISAAHYINGLHACGLKVERMVMIAVEKTKPFVSCEFEVTREIIEIGESKLLRLKDDLKFYYETNTWPGYLGEIFIPDREKLTHTEEEENEFDTN